MKQVKRINRKALALAVTRLMSEQRVAARTQVKERVAQEMDMDERVLVLRTLKELHPSLATEFDKIIDSLKGDAGYEACKDLPNTWISSDTREIIRGRLELMPDIELQSLSLERLVNLIGND